MSKHEADRIVAIAGEAMAAMIGGAQVPSFSSRHLGFDLPEAYAVAHEICRLRGLRDERPVGRKIGFTNKDVWRGYAISGPIWNHMFDTTVRRLDTVSGPFVLPKLPELRIEPEIVFHFRADPSAEMSDLDLLSCVDWFAHGFEIVFSIFPGWRFTAADAVAAFGVHARLLLGAPRKVDHPSPDVVAALRSFTVELSCDDGTVRQGGGAKVLGSPLEAVRFLLETLALDPDSEPLRAGETVTTGTLTEAMPLAAGQSWSTSIRGIDLPGLAVSFA